MESINKMTKRISNNLNLEIMKRKTVGIYKRQDDDGHWFWIPEDEIVEFNIALSKLEGKSYMDCPDDFDNFSEKFEVYRTGGSPEISPNYFHDNGYVTEIAPEPKEWPDIIEIIRQRENTKGWIKDK